MTDLNKNKVTLFPSFPNLLSKGIKVPGQRNKRGYDNGAVPHSHMSFLGTYETSLLQAKFSFSEIGDNMQLLCY